MTYVITSKLFLFIFIFLVINMQIVNILVFHSNNDVFFSQINYLSQTQKNHQIKLQLILLLYLTL